MDEFIFFSGNLEPFAIHEGNGIVFLYNPLQPNSEAEIIELPYNPISKKRFIPYETVNAMLSSGFIAIIECFPQGNLVLKEITGQFIKQDPIEGQDFEYML